MNAIVQTQGPGDARFDLPSDWPALTPCDLDRTRPDAHCLLVGRHGAALARVSVWWSHVASLVHERLGLIGHFGAVDLASGVQMLEHAAQCLARAGASLAIGPIDGSTWEPYRCVVESDGSPPFALEPAHPMFWHDAFAQAGFAPWARYRSALCDDLAQEMRRFEGLAARIHRRSRARVRAVDPARWQHELSRVHGLVSRAFAPSRLFTAIDEAGFVRRFDALSSMVAPDLAWLAEIDGEVAGFVLALQGTGPVWGDSVIVKTLCTAQPASPAAASFLLMHRVLRSAQERGLRRAVFALIDEMNLSSRMVGERINSRTFRRYALFARRLV